MSGETISCADDAPQPAPDGDDGAEVNIRIKWLNGRTEVYSMGENCTV